MHSRGALTNKQEQTGPEGRRMTRASVPPTLQRMLALQRDVGNRAASVLVARAPGMPDLLPLAAGRYAADLRKMSIIQIASLNHRLQGAWSPGAGVGVEFADRSVKLTADEAAALAPIAAQRVRQFFSDFASGRTPLFQSMRAAADGDARRAAIHALRDYDQAELPTPRALRDALGGTWSDITDAGQRDAVLAALQLAAATDSEGELTSDTATVHKRVADSAGGSLNDEWCGYFSMEGYQRGAAMDPDFANSFASTYSVELFFTYAHDSGIVMRSPKWLWDGARWRDVQEYHHERGSERTWLSGAAITAGTQLDIRPGDMVVTDNEGDGKSDHIVKCQSFDPATGLLITIGGNDSGMIVRPAGEADPVHESAADRADRLAAEAATGKKMKVGGWDTGQAGGHVGIGVRDTHATGAKGFGLVYGVGRPSLVDFEDHEWWAKDVKTTPPPPKTAQTAKK
jgi:hypothetical protein